MEEDYAPVELFNEYFSGGMSSIVVQELAYSAYAFSSYPRWKDDAFLNIGRISCQADKTIEAVTTFLDLFEQTPDSVERFEASKNSILGQFRSFRQPFRNIPSILTGLERKGYETTPSPSYYKIATNSTIETIKQFHTDHVKGKKMTVCIVGDKTKIDMEALKKVGKLEELTIEDIYSF